MSNIRYALLLLGVLLSVGGGRGAGIGAGIIAFVGFGYELFIRMIVYCVLPPFVLGLVILAVFGQPHRERPPFVPIAEPQPTEYLTMAAAVFAIAYIGHIVCKEYL